MTIGFPHEEGYFPFHHKVEGWNIAHVSKDQFNRFQVEIIGSSLIWDGNDQWYEYWGPVRWLSRVDFSKLAKYKTQFNDTKYRLGGCDD